MLGIDRAKAETLGLRLYKIGLVWPLEPDGLSEFVDGLETVLVVEEKRGVIEDQVKALFLEWLQREYPEKAARIEHLIRETRGGNLSDPRFGSRMRGEGETAKIIKKLFDVHAARLGLNKSLPPLSSKAFRRPRRAGEQMPLFDH